MEDRQDALAASIARRFKLAVRIHRGSRRKRPTRRNLREARRAQIAKVLPDAVEELRAQGLWIPPEPEVKAHANAYADELADRSYSDRVVTMRPHDTPRGRESHRGRPGHRRTRSTRAGPSDDDGPGEPPPAARWLTIALKPRTVYHFGCLSREKRRASVPLQDDPARRRPPLPGPSR